MCSLKQVVYRTNVTNVTVFVYYVVEIHAISDAAYDFVKVALRPVHNKNDNYNNYDANVVYYAVYSSTVLKQDGL